MKNKRGDLLTTVFSGARGIYKNSDVLFQGQQTRYDLLRRELGENLPLKAQGRLIGVNLNYLDTMLNDACERMVRDGELRIMSAKEIERHRKNLRHAFSNTGMERVKGAEVEINVAEDAPAFLMIPPYRKPRDPVKEDRDRFNDVFKGRLTDYRNWDALVLAIRQSGGRVVVLNDDNESGGRRETFTRDRFFIVGKKAFVPDPASKDANDIEGINDYHGEAEQVKKFLRESGYDVVQVSNCWFEGGNIILHPQKKTAFMGIEYDAGETSAGLLDTAIKEHLGSDWNIKQVPLPKTKEDAKDFYHLDLGMSEPLPRGEMVIWPSITDEKTYAEICDIVGRDKIIEISRSEAYGRRAAGLVPIQGDTILLTQRGIVESQLNQRGYKTIIPDQYGAWTFSASSDASAHCGTNPLPRPR